MEYSISYAIIILTPPHPPPPPHLGRSGPNLEPGTMRVYVTIGSRNGLHIGRKVGPCPGSQRRWVLGSGHAFSQAVHAANTYRPRFQVMTLGPDLLTRSSLLRTASGRADRPAHPYGIHLLRAERDRPQDHRRGGAGPDPLLPPDARHVG